MATHEDARREYATGRVFELDESLQIQVVAPLRIQSGRPSQVVRVVAVGGHLQGIQLVAKFYDAKYGPREVAMPSPEIICQAHESNERRAYEKLSPFSATFLPKYYGEFHYQRVSNDSVQTIPVILIEYITNSIHWADNLDTNQRNSLCAIIKSEAAGIIEKIHAAGITHGDLVASNFLTNNTFDRLVLIDFETSVCEGFMYIQEKERQSKNAQIFVRRVRSDKSMLEAMLEEL
jgi:serine/threonine protein kinase